MMKTTFYLPISTKDYSRFLQGVNIGRRKHKSRPPKMFPLFKSEQEAVSAYKRKLNSIKSYAQEFEVLIFEINTKNKNLIWIDSNPYWDSCLSRQFFVGARHYNQRRNLLDILCTLAVQNLKGLRKVA